MEFIKKGYAQILGHKRMLLVLWGINLLVGVVFVLPVFILLRKTTSHSLVGELPGGLENFHVIADLIANHGIGISISVPLMAAGLVFFLVFSLFLAGGILTVLNEGRGYRPSAFWGGAGSWFGPFFRLLLFTLPLAVVAVLAGVLCKWLTGVIWGDDPYQYISYWAAWFRFFVVLCGLFVWLRVMDYARMVMVTSASRGAFRATLKGLRFVFGHFGRTVFLALAFVVPGTLLMVLTSPLRMGEGGLLIFLFMQVYLLCRLGLKVGLNGAELAFYQSLFPPAVPEPEQAGSDGSEGVIPKTEGYYDEEGPTLDDASGQGRVVVPVTEGFAESEMPTFGNLQPPGEEDRLDPHEADTLDRRPDEDR